MVCVCVLSFSFSLRDVPVSVHGFAGESTTPTNPLTHIGKPGINLSTYVHARFLSPPLAKISSAILLTISEEQRRSSRGEKRENKKKLRRIKGLSGPAN